MAAVSVKEELQCTRPVCVFVSIYWGTGSFISKKKQKTKHGLCLHHGIRKVSKKQQQIKKRNTLMLSINKLMMLIRRQKK